MRSHIAQVAKCHEKAEAEARASPPSIGLEYNTTQPSPVPQHHKRPYIEEAEDDSVNNTTSAYDPNWLYEQVYPRPAGVPIRHCQSFFEEYRSKQKAEGMEPWEPFASEDEWELARWLMESGASQGKIDSFLRLNKIRNDVKPGFRNKRAFFQYIDRLPRGPAFSCTPMHVVGDLKDKDGKKCMETLELWHRDILECIKELMGNPSFKEHQAYAPVRQFREMKDSIPYNRQYSEMWTGNWWWEVQDQLPNGATVAPIILASDETQLSTFSGDKKAWPLYLTVGNIEKCVRRKPTSRSWILLGYIPVSSLECFSKERRSVEGCQLFHDCVKKMLQPLIEKGIQATEMGCSDGFIQDVIATLAKQSQGYHPQKFIDQNLRPLNPFWKDLPLCNIFDSMTPDLLHQMHKGVFSDHTSKWARSSVENGDNEIDARFCAMPTHPSLRHFKNGISGVTQWTGGEYQSMAKVFLGTVVGAADDGVVRAIRCVKDYMYYAHFESHCDQSLEAMEASWGGFHKEKQVFIDLGIRKQFNIPKMHNVCHYGCSIRSRGTLDGYNSETTERLHIDLAKAGYRASNKRKYMVQMTVWLRRQEAVQRFASYLQWAVPGYIAELTGEEEADNEDEDEEEAEEEDQDITEYKVAKRPPLRGTVTSIEKDYDADWFIWYLNEFFTDYSIDRANGDPLTNDTVFPIYKQIRLSLPSLPEALSENQIDVVHATHAEPEVWTWKGLTPAKPALTSTVLVRVGTNDPSKGPLHGLQAARVYLLFRLPLHIGSYPHPLAYVRWFKPFNSAPVEDSLLFKLSYSTRMRERHCSIIPVTRIMQTCHLYPNFGRSVNPLWTSHQILDQAPSFYLNPYLRHRDFYLFRYQVHLFLKAKEDFAREIQRKRARRA
ncbi:hypothetical protein C8J55DRAFT_455705 [Lentinula edodes]|uniref:Uncharacterized protein n=1 Tax=Lentinula lateritia TaxID=40482 RepID=A0A9W9ACM4_9AGAR|nr:hypothetical protein C8J55DRAFT_455705 [Lentinula edodes]